jgi:hypothetical protein
MVVHRYGLEGSECGHRGIVHPNINAPESSAGAARQVLDRSRIGDIERHHHRVSCRSSALLDERLQHIVAARSEHDVCAAPGKPQRCGSSNAAGRPSNDHDRTFSHHCIPSV